MIASLSDIINLSLLKIAVSSHRIIFIIYEQIYLCSSHIFFV